ncbi:MAG TPA: cytidine deaminase [Usitatibacter sp.]|nr:cytidine deaminase [Usitatibacter sp.]
MAASLTQRQIDSLLEAARAVQKRAHAPYSNFLVGAAVLDDQDRVHSGCNVENAAFPLGICAEACAIATMVAQGSRRVRAVLVLGDGKDLVPPCGGCRQRLREFADPDLPILVADRNGVRARFTLGELLPHSFGPENLTP